MRHSRETRRERDSFSCVLLSRSKRTQIFCAWIRSKDDVNDIRTFPSVALCIVATRAPRNMTDRLQSCERGKCAQKSPQNTSLDTRKRMTGNNSNNNTNNNSNNGMIDLLSAFAQFACAPIVSLPGFAAIATLRAVRDRKKMSSPLEVQIGNGNGNGVITKSNKKNAAFKPPINAPPLVVFGPMVKDIVQSVLVSLVSRQILNTLRADDGDGAKENKKGGVFGRKVNAKRNDGKRRQRYEEENFRLVCVTGTYQEGYKNREMLNSEDGREAVFVGYALVRGCGLHFDVKADDDEDVDEDDTLLKQKKEEEDDDVYDENDIAPVVVLTNDERDAVVYSVYAVPCDALITNLFDSGLNARLMGVSSDTAAIDLAAVETSTSVRVAAQANEGFGFALTMLSFARPKKSSVCARPLYEKRDGTRVYAFNDEQLENCGITSGSSLAKIRAICAKSSGGKKESNNTTVEEAVTDVENKTDENNNEASSWPMNLLRSTGLFETEGDAEEKMKEEEDELLVKDKKAPLGESSNISQNNNENVGGFFASFLSPVNISANKKSSAAGEEEENHKSSSATTQQTPGALGDQVLYPATVASPWPDESRDADEDYVPDYEAEDFDYDDEPLSGGSSLMVTPTKEATGGNRRNGSFYESATTTPNAEKVRDEPRPFGSVNAVAATTSIASTSSPTEEKEAHSSEYVYSVDSESDAVSSADKKSVARAFKASSNSNWGENNKIEKAMKEYKMLGGVDVARLYTRTRERKSAQKSIGLVNKSTRLVDFASCQRAVKYAETFHTKDDGSDGGVLPRSRAVWFDGRRCRM